MRNVLFAIVLKNASSICSTWPEFPIFLNKPLISCGSIKNFREKAKTNPNKLAGEHTKGKKSSSLAICLILITSVFGLSVSIIGSLVSGLAGLK